MELELLRISTEPDSTSGILFHKLEDGSRRFLSYTVEDTYRKAKIKHITRIPSNRYQIKFRKVGGFNKRYTDYYSASGKDPRANFNHGMLELQNVEEDNDRYEKMAYKFVLIHKGNSSKSSSGCVILTDSQENNQRVKGGWGGNSNTNYVRTYPKIAKELLKGNEVWINVIDFDFGEDPDEHKKPKRRKVDQNRRSTQKIDPRIRSRSL